MYGTLRKHFIRLYDTEVTNNPGPFLFEFVQQQYFRNKNSGCSFPFPNNNIPLHAAALLEGRTCLPECTAVRLGRQSPVTRARMPASHTCSAARLLRLILLTGACNIFHERGYPACSMNCCLVSDEVRARQRL